MTIPKIGGIAIVTGTNDTITFNFAGTGVYALVFNAGPNIALAFLLQ